MTFQVKLSESEVKAIVAEHLSKALSLPVAADDLTGESYSCSLTLGKYDSYHFPPKPPKPEKVAPPAPVEVAVATEPEAVASEEKPF